MPLVDGASHRREGGAGDDALDVERVRQRLRNGPDVALRSGIEGRAVLEDELTAALRLQPVQCLERSSDRILDRNRPRFQRHDARLDLRGGGADRNAHVLRGHETSLPRQALGEGVGDVACTGEVVRDHADQHWTPPTRLFMRVTAASGAARTGTSTSLRTLSAAREVEKWASMMAS